MMVGGHGDDMSGSKYTGDAAGVRSGDGWWRGRWGRGRRRSTGRALGKNEVRKW